MPRECNPNNERSSTPWIPAEQERERARERIRETGLRATPSRIATLVAVEEQRSPISHPELAGMLADLGFDKTTTFRNLSDLVSAGLLQRNDLGDHVYRFERAAAETERHPHFLCTECGSVTCLDQVRLTASSVRQSEQIGNVTEILLRGCCRSCQ